MDLQQTITNQNDVSLKLAGYVSSMEAKNSNLVFSPISLQLVLGLIANGSTGSTRDQILTFLKSKSCDDLNNFSSQIISKVFYDGSSLGGPRFRFVNGLWVDQTLTLKTPFKEVVDSVYKASYNQVDFLNNADNVIPIVNSWVKEQTNGLITELLPPGSIHNNTNLLFANAMYFKGTWTNTFDSSSTKEDNFYLLNGNSIKVPFMTSEEVQFIRALF